MTRLRKYLQGLGDDDHKRYLSLAHILPEGVICYLYHIHKIDSRCILCSDTNRKPMAFTELWGTEE